MVEVISALVILSVVFGIVLMISSNIMDTGKSNTTLRIESEIDFLILEEVENRTFKDQTYVSDGYAIHVQFDRDQDKKILVYGTYQATSNTGKEISKQEFLFLDK